MDWKGKKMQKYTRIVLASVIELPTTVPMQKQQPCHEKFTKKCGTFLCFIFLCRSQGWLRDVLANRFCFPVGWELHQTLGLLGDKYVRVKANCFASVTQSDDICLNPHFPCCCVIFLFCGSQGRFRQVLASREDMQMLLPLAGWKLYV